MENCVRTASDEIEQGVEEAAVKLPLLKSNEWDEAEYDIHTGIVDAGKIVMMLWILIAVSFLAITYYKLYIPMTYWNKMNVKQVSQFSTIVDTIKILLKSLLFAEYLQKIYKQYRNERYIGFYMMQKPMLLINDPDLVRQITVKDFDHFTDHKTFITEKNEPILSMALALLKGDKWRRMRSTLSPIFTSSKIKAMYVLMVEIAEQYTNHFVENDSTNLEVKDMFHRYGNDVIATCAFGVKCDSLKDRNNDFYQLGCLLSPSKITVRMFFMMMFPKLSEMIRLTVYPPHVISFFKNLVADTIKVREERNIVRPDLIHLLMQTSIGKLKYEETDKTVSAKLQDKSGKSEHLTIDTMTAQLLLFFIAGFNAVSVLMTFLCYELIVNPDVQERLIREIDETFITENGRLSYEALNKMKYLDMTILETIRKCVASGLDRECTKLYTVQPTRPSEKPVHLKPGFRVWIPSNAFHMDPEYFPNPERFDPERFNDENKINIKPFTFLPFGAGPRNCIASRFALIKVKTIIVHLLSKFKMVANEKTEIPIKLKAAGVDTVPANGLYLDLKRRNV